MNKLTETAPNVIYLQVSEDEDHLNEPFPYGFDEITWCADSVLDAEVKYTRADLANIIPPDVTELQAQLERYKAVMDDMAEALRNIATNSSSYDCHYPRYIDEALARYNTLKGEYASQTHNA